MAENLLAIERKHVSCINSKEYKIENTSITITTYTRKSWFLLTGINQLLDGLTMSIVMICYVVSRWRCENTFIILAFHLRQKIFFLYDMNKYFTEFNTLRYSNLFVRNFVWNLNFINFFFIFSWYFDTHCINFFSLTL